MQPSRVKRTIKETRRRQTFKKDQEEPEVEQAEDEVVREQPEKVDDFAHYTFTAGSTGEKREKPTLQRSADAPVAAAVALRDVDKRVLLAFHRHVSKRFRTWKAAWIEGFDCLSADDNEAIERSDFCTARLFDGFEDSPYHVWSLLDPHEVGEITFKTLRGHAGVL